MYPVVWSMVQVRLIIEFLSCEAGGEWDYFRGRRDYSWLTKVTEQRDIIFRVTQFHPLTESRCSTETAGWIARKFIRNIHVYIIYSNI